MDIILRSEDGIDILAPEGRFDSPVAAQFRRMVEERIDGGNRRFVIDMGSVEFIDSTGLGVLVGCMRRASAAGGGLCLCALRPKVMGVFSLTQLDRVFPIHDRLDAALAAWETD